MIEFDELKYSKSTALHDSFSPRAMFVQYTSTPGGSPISGLMIVKALLSEKWDVDVVFGDCGSMSADYEAVGCRIHVVPHGQWLIGGSAFRRIRRWGREFRATWLFLNLMRRLKPDLVYINTLMGLAPALAARALGIPCIWHIRELFKDMGGEVHDPLGGRSLVRLLLGHMAWHIIALSKAVVKNVLTETLKTPVSIIPNAIADDFFSETFSLKECRNHLGLPLNKLIIGVPGTLRPVKGHQFFLKAAELITNRFPDCEFIISGDGEPSYRKRLLDQVSALGLKERVHFLGTINDMRLFYRACDVICIPSVSESFGRTVIEAFALSVPLVATRVGGMAEIVEDGNTGFLVPYGDCEKLADRLIRLLQDPGLREELACKGRQKAEDCYREEAYRRRVLEIVEQVMQKPGKNCQS